jgi:endonuclease-3
MIYYAREFSPARGWDLDKDHITSTIGRKSILKKLKK